MCTIDDLNELNEGRHKARRGKPFGEYDCHWLDFEQLGTADRGRSAMDIYTDSATGKGGKKRKNGREGREESCSSHVEIKIGNQRERDLETRGE